MGKIKNKQKPTDLQQEQASPFPSSFNKPCGFLQYKHLKCKHDPHVKIEGKDTDDWMCVDFGKLFWRILQVTDGTTLILSCFQLQKD